MADAMAMAAGTAAKQSSGPVQYQPLKDIPAVFDQDTNRTYQLVHRASDAVPHMLSCTGAHTGTAMLDAINASRALSHERGILQKPLTERPERYQLPKDKTAARIAEIAAQLKAALSVNAERTDRVTRGLQVYGQRQGS